MSPLERVFLFREGGMIRRYHVFPVTREQNVGEHSFGVAAILIAVMGEVLTLPLMKAAIQHDISELVTGDIPYHAKRREPELRTVAGRITREFELRHDLRETLNDFEASALAWADLAEAVLWLLEEGLRGSAYAWENLRECPSVLYTKVTPPTNRAAEVATEVGQIIQDYAPLNGLPRAFPRSFVM